MLDYLFGRLLPRLPVPVRKGAVVLLNRAPGLGFSSKEAWTLVGLGDLARTDNLEFNRFVWANHLGPARWFEASWRFESGIEPSRKVFFEELERQLKAIGVEPQAVRSVLEVGSSLGVNLRYLEEGLFANAELVGLDIDADAVRQGSEYLAGLHSRIRLEHADMSQLDDVLKDREFDIVLCTGVLMYFPSPAASGVIGAMLRHSRHLVAMSEPWDPMGPSIREDGANCHDLEAIVRQRSARLVAVQHRPKLHYGVSHQFVFAQRALPFAIRQPAGRAVSGGRALP
ncbi:MAG: class I SAM-dependent methyltransferase [Candidatus Dormibacteraeota bacterium]|nr:class I SAM-dependent methyltransferase [Candidatus Dormibacteraeota bacterium]